jgi:VanZ family protein
MLNEPLRLWRLAFFTCAAAVLVLSLIPIDQPAPSTGWDKTDHLLGFAILMLLGVRSFSKHRMPLAIALLFYGIAIELLQSLTTYRFGEWRDVVADAAGIALAMLLARIPGVDQRQQASP